MRLSFALVLLLPSFAYAQPTAEQKKATVKWVTDLQDPAGGFYLAPQPPNVDAKPVSMLRATNGAVRALKYLGAEIPNKEKHAAFVLKCYDPKTGAFAEPGGKPDVAITSIGVMAAMELGIPKEKFAKAMDYLKENAKTFEEVRIGAAAVEAWGVKDCPFKLDEWFKVADRHLDVIGKPSPIDGGARELGSYAAMALRLGQQPPLEPVAKDILAGQRDDGGWGKKSEKASDIESTYRVMRALMLFKEKPKNTKKLRAFLDSHRNADGGYATKPGDKSSMSGVYYCIIVSKWLDEMEGK
jgi:prenyltransferase beta subunit